jgi:hypothetical protein
LGEERGRKRKKEEERRANFAAKLQKGVKEAVTKQERGNRC